MALILEDLDLWKLDHLASVNRQLRLILRSRIIRNDLKPNQKISEPGLAKQYGVSRQPVREAFITLAQEGLVEILPQRGTLVRRIDYEVVLDCRFIREAFEADVMRQLAVKPDAELIAILRQQIKQQKKVSGNQPAQFIELDEKFHRTLSQAAGLNRAWDFIDSTKAQMDRVRFMSFEEFPITRLISQHTLIVDCIEQQDSAGAEDAIRKHLREILSSLPKIRTLYPDHFDNFRKAGSADTTHPS